MYEMVWIIAVLLIEVTPKEINLSPPASWNQNGTTVGGSADGIAGASPSQLHQPRGLSITINDVLYISDTENHRIVVVHLDSTINSCIIGSGPDSDLNRFNAPRDVFTTNTSLYVLERNNNRVQKLSLNGSDPTTILTYDNSPDTPYYLYVDHDANIYLNDDNNGIVFRFCSNSSKGVIVAGTGSSGSENSELNEPYGVFVDFNDTIYIADRLNHRIMKWMSGASSGIRVAGDGTSGSGVTQLSYPIYVTVDTNEYMYITDTGNNRITRWAPNLTFGVCIAACTGTSGTAPTQLFSPVSLAFDSKGSLYVSDHYNHRVQKFQILSNQTQTSSPFVPSSSYPYSTSNDKILETLCDKLQPCQNGGTCTSTNDQQNYTCSCAPGFTGVRCQSDDRPCQNNTCWNNGTCYTISNTTFNCTCAPGWKGDHCERMIDYCFNIICQNRGVCRRSLLKYTCVCLSSYSGEYCETTTNTLIIYQTVSRSFSYVAIIAMGSVVMFVVIMDILKYCFGIDPVEKERRRMRRAKRAKKRKPIIQRFVYVNAPPSSEQVVVTARETTI